MIEDFRDRSCEFRQSVSILNRQKRPQPTIKQSFVAKINTLNSDFSLKAIAINSGIFEANNHLAELKTSTNISKFLEAQWSYGEDLSKQFVQLKQSLAIFNRATDELSEKLDENTSKALREHEYQVIQYLKTNLADSNRQFGEFIADRTKHQRRSRFLYKSSDANEKAFTDHTNSATLDFESRYRGNTIASTSYNTAQYVPLNAEDLEGGLQVTNASYDSSRYTAIQGIESAVHELSSVYQHLANMVSAQGEMVQRVDQHLEQVQVNMRRGRLQLERYFRNMTSEQWLIIKIFTALVILIILAGFIFT